MFKDTKEGSTNYCKHRKDNDFTKCAICFTFSEPRSIHKAKFLFADMVVVDGNLIGVVVKSLESLNRIPGNQKHKDRFYYEVYVRSYRMIKEYTESDIERYQVRHKELSDEEMEWQNQ